jgi:hypothetical protein
MSGADILSSCDTSVVVQEICGGPELSVDAFFDFQTGTVKAVARERIEVKSGVATKARLFESIELTEYASRIGQALSQRGTICFQVMTVGSRYVVTDLNCRPGAGTAMTIAAGIDVIAGSLACRWSEPYAHYLAHELPLNGSIVTRQYSEFLMQGN